MGNLGRHAHRLPSLDPVPDCLHEIVIFIMRQPAHTEGLNDQPVISREKGIQHLPVNSRYQLQKKNLLVHLMVKHQRFGRLVLVINVENNFLIMDGRNIRIINAGKSIIAFGKFLLRPGTCYHLASKHNGNSMGPVMGSKPQTVHQIRPCICNCQINRLLRSGNYNGPAVILNKIRQSRSCICHGIGSMAKHKPVIKFIFRLNQSRQLQPVICTHIGAVQGKGLHRINGTEFFRLRNIFQQFLRRNLRCQSICCIF